MGEYKVKLYTEKDIDYFIGVDLDTIFYLYISLLSIEVLLV